MSCLSRVIGLLPIILLQWKIAWGFSHSNHIVKPPWAPSGTDLSSFDLCTLCMTPSLHSDLPCSHHIITRTMKASVHSREGIGYLLSHSGKMLVMVTPALLAAVLPSNSREPALTNVNYTSSSQGPMIWHRWAWVGTQPLPTLLRFPIRYALWNLPRDRTIKRYDLIPDNN